MINHSRRLETFVAATVVAALFLGGCASAPPVVTTDQLDFPSPLAGPGRPEVEDGVAREIGDGWEALARGDLDAAASAAQQTRSNPAGRLLALQTSVMTDKAGTVSELENFVSSHPDYAAAWLTLAAAAESAGQRHTAFEAARHGSELWPIERWGKRSRRLQSLWVDEPIAEATRLIENDQAEAALEKLDSVLTVDPGNRDAILVRAEVLIATGELDRAEAALSALTRDDDVALLAGRIAEERGDTAAAMRIYSTLPGNIEATTSGIAIAEQEGDWLTAMNLYDALPDDEPGKAEGLRRAKLRWRLSVMPSYVQKAVHSEALDREELAVVLVSLAPRVETLAAGEVPLLSDIMQLPTQREILTAVRLGLVETDRFERLFRPHLPVSADEAQAAVTRLAALLSVDDPRWCEGSDPPCSELSEPVSGETLATVVIDMMTRDDT
jgi:thioredoxin-like negative regulator of GroEL